MPKKGHKRLKKEDKKNEILKFLDVFRNQCEEFESRMIFLCDEACVKVRKMYADKLKSLPENIRNMTLNEYIAIQETSVQGEETEKTKDLHSAYEKTKVMSEKKKTLKKKTRKEERKRSMSVSVFSSSQASMQPSFLPRMSRVLTDSNIFTPLSKRSVVAPPYVVTPKFDPKVPINKNYLRRPKPGELVMSVSGSPLQNLIEDLPDKPGLAISLGDGKIIKITEDTEVAKLENDLGKKLNYDTKIILEDMKNKLDRILKS